MTAAPMLAARPSPMTAGEILIYDGEERCPYLAERTARMPLRRPLLRLSPDDLDARLAAGDRRTGAYLYNTRCPDCAACEAIRLPVARFRPSRTQRRIWRRGCRLLTLESGPPLVDELHLDLFNRHRRQRKMATGRDDIDSMGYEQFLVDTCCETIEIRYRHEERVVAVAICDLGQTAVSAVYTYFDPDFRLLSLGVFSILNQVELCRSTHRQWLYLGYYIEDSPHMCYKATYRPHERRIQGQWRAFDA